MKRSALPAPEDKARTVREMFDRIAARYDRVNRIMTLGLDVRWRRRAVHSLQLAPGALVLDLACGTGDLCRELSASGYQTIGVDFAFQMLRAARTDAALVQADALRLPLADARADGVTCGFALRNVTDLQPLFAEIARVVRPGGRVAILETSAPSGHLARLGHRAYFRGFVPLIGGILSDRAAYRYLPQSTAYLPPTSELLMMLRASGFGDLTQTQLALGSAQLITGARE